MFYVSTLFWVKGILLERKFIVELYIVQLKFIVNSSRGNFSIFLEAFLSVKENNSK